MNTIMQRTAARLCAVLGAGAVLLAAQGPAASAQGFQYTYGGATCRESGWNGVQQVSTGGYIAVGETFSTVAGCGTSSIYVVRTLPNGAQAWSFAYNIGTLDTATDVQECANGDFIITGVTHTNNASGCTITRDIFLMRIPAGGGLPLWVNTYDGGGSDDIAYDVMEVTQAPPGTCVNNINIGDFVVAGSTTRNQNPGNRDAIIIRTNPGGAVIWSDQFGTPGGDDYFYSVDETSVTPIMGGIAGDIIAAGGSNSYSASPDCFVVRMSGCTGMANTNTLQGVGVFGNGGFEEVRSVRYIRFGPNQGNLITVGSTTSTSANTEIYIREGNINVGVGPCPTISEVTYGDNGPLPDEAYGVRELQSANPLINGHYAITGLTNIIQAPLFGGGDAFLLEAAPNTLAPVNAGFHIYGGRNLDLGRSVNQVVANPGVGTTAGFIIAGLTQSVPLVVAGDPEQMYLIKTGVLGTSGCNELAVNTAPTAVQFATSCFNLTPVPFAVSCTPGINYVPTAWPMKICSTAALSPGQRNDGRGNDGVSGVDPSPSSGVDADLVYAYPNPVEAGGTLHLEYRLAERSRVSVVVSDITGKVLLDRSREYAAGVASIEVGTEGWAAGTYLVKTTLPGRTDVQRVVVKGK